MKNRKSILVVFAILALLCLGIGYAALSDTLVMTGTVLADGSGNKIEEESRFDVDWEKFADPSTIVGNTTFEAGTIDDENDTVTFTVSGFTTKGDTIWVHAYFINNSPENLTANVTSTLEVSGTGKEKFSIAHYITSENDADKNAHTTVAQGKSGYLTIAITLDQTLLSSDDIELTITVKLSASDM